MNYFLKIRQICCIVHVTSTLYVFEILVGSLLHTNKGGVEQLAPIGIPTDFGKT